MDKIHVLLVEDNEGDILLISEALQDSKMPIAISVVKDGKAALDFLEKTGGYKKVKMPDLVFLDVNLPKKNGHEVLKYIKHSPLLQHIPVVMLTTSSSANDINNAYKHFVNCFVTKPVELDDFMETVVNIGKFWISTVKLPVS
ncbi:MAG: response regulator [Bacteroidota bacterium]|nr:response regulator [Bacteroidota bacterium]